MIYKVTELPICIGCYLCFVLNEVLDLDFYFDLNACGKLYAHQSVNNLLGRLDDVDKTLVCTHFELLTAILVLVYRTENGYDLLLGRKRDRTGNCCAVSLRYLNDLLCCCIDESVVVALQSYSDLFLDCHLFLPPVSICSVHIRAYIIKLYAAANRIRGAFPQHRAVCFFSTHLKIRKPRQAPHGRGIRVNEQTVGTHSEWDLLRPFNRTYSAKIT